MWGEKKKNLEQTRCGLGDGRSLPSTLGFWLLQFKLSFWRMDGALCAPQCPSAGMFVTQQPVRCVQGLQALRQRRKAVSENNCWTRELKKQLSADRVFATALHMCHSQNFCHSQGVRVGSLLNEELCVLYSLLNI